jgi:hypothetical protein
VSEETPQAPTGAFIASSEDRPTVDSDDIVSAPCRQTSFSGGWILPGRAVAGKALPHGLGSKN